MNKKHIIAIIVILAVGGFVGWKILGLERGKRAGLGHHDHDHGEHGEHEQRVKLTPKQIEMSGIVIAEADSATIKTTLKLFGKLGPNEDRIAHVLPRYAGVVRKVNKRVGDLVKKGDTLAVIESSESLQTYDVRSEIDGTVVQKDITIGEVVPIEKRIFVVVDLSVVWVNLNVYRQDFAKMRVGQKVVIDAGVGLPSVDAEISYLSPFGADSTQTMLARAEIPNTNGLLRPGLFVEGYAILEEAEVDVAVREEALQTLDYLTVVFVQDGDSFEARPVKLGRRGAGWVEITSGLLPGEKYVAANSFILKAELGKAGAGHDH